MYSILLYNTLQHTALLYIHAAHTCRPHLMGSTDYLVASVHSEHCRRHILTLSIQARALLRCRRRRCRRTAAWLLAIQVFFHSSSSPACVFCFRVHMRFKTHVSTSTHHSKSKGYVCYAMHDTQCAHTQSLLARTHWDGN